MKHKYTLFIFLLFFCNSYSFAQIETKPSIAVVPFVHLGFYIESYREAESLTEVVEKAIVKSKRFDVVDRANFKLTYEEMELQKGEDFIEGKVVEQGKKIGAEYLVVGRIKHIQARRDYDIDKAYLGYAGYIQFGLKIIEVKTGKIVGSELFDLKTQDGPTIEEDAYSLPSQAVEAVIPFSQHFVERFIDHYFPARVSVVKVESAKKEEAKTVLISGGSGIGLEKGNRLKIVHVQMLEVSGKAVKRNKIIGEIRVSEVEDSNFSVCKVVSGGSEIYQQLKAGKILEAKTKTRKIINKNYF